VLCYLVGQMHCNNYGYLWNTLSDSGKLTISLSTIWIVGAEAAQYRVDVEENQGSVEKRISHSEIPCQNAA
jgi:hypothetical protein